MDAEIPNRVWTETVSCILHIRQVKQSVRYSQDYVDFIQPAARSLESTICFRVRYSDSLGEAFGMVGERLSFRGCIEFSHPPPGNNTANRGSDHKINAGLAHAVSLNRPRDFGKKGIPQGQVTLPKCSTFAFRP